MALREEDNFNGDELFGDSQANEDDPDDGSHDLEGGRAEFEGRRAGGEGGQPCCKHMSMLP